MRITVFQRSSPTRKTAPTTLIVENLDQSVTSVQLHTLLSRYGAVLCCEVAEGYMKSERFGVVKFYSKESAYFAPRLPFMNLPLGKGRYACPISLERERERKDACEEPILILYVKNLDEDVTEDLLHAKFSEYGNCNVFIMTDSERKSVGFATVIFESHEDAKKAMEALNGALIGSKRLSIGINSEHFNHDVHLFRKWNKLKDSNLFLHNLALSIDDRKLEEIFSAFGEVTPSKVMRHDNGLSKRFGFVGLSIPEDAKKAHESFDGNLLEGKCVYVVVPQGNHEYTTNRNLAPPVLQHNYQRYYSIYPLMRQSQQGTCTTMGWVYQHHPGDAAKLTRGHMEMNKFGIPKILQSPTFLGCASWQSC